MKKYIYFDNAATTAFKPDSVSRAVIAALDHHGNPGRSGHDLSLASASIIFNCRESLCRLFGYDKPERIIFTQNATMALNMAIKGFASEGCHILFSNYEHNSVIRPVHALSKNPASGITYTVFDASKNDNETIYDFTSKIRPNTTLAVITYASNVCGKILPIAKISQICKRKGILLICDASQAAGCVPINVNAMGIDVLCFAGHKSLYGPQGTGGALFCTDKLPRPILEGGNGLNSADKNMTGLLPELLEAGTLNTPGINGLNAGINHISKIGISEIFEKNSYLINRLTDNLMNINGIRLYGLNRNRTPTLIFNKDGMPSEELTQKLNEYRICVRGGFHCAPIAHVALSTGEYGAVRASLSFENTVNEIDTFCHILARLH